MGLHVIFEVILVYTCSYYKFKNKYIHTFEIIVWYNTRMLLNIHCTLFLIFLLICSFCIENRILHLESSWFFILHQPSSWIKMKYYMHPISRYFASYYIQKILPSSDLACFLLTGCSITFWWSMNRYNILNLRINDPWFWENFFLWPFFCYRKICVV